MKGLITQIIILLVIYANAPTLRLRHHKVISKYESPSFETIPEENEVTNFADEFANARRNSIWRQLYSNF